MKTRIIILSILISLFSSNIFAQSDRESLWLVRVNGSYNFLTDESRGHHPVDKTWEFNIEAGYKKFLIPNKGWYLEGGANFFWSKGNLPFNEFWLYNPIKDIFTDFMLDYERGGVMYWKIKEKGIGLKVLFGYDFKLFSLASFELFSGLEARFAWNSNMENIKNWSGPLRRFYPRWQAGVGINYWRFSLNCTFSTDLYHRTKKSEMNYYRLNYLSVGLAYRFGL